MSALILGPIAFSDFELPPRMVFGGRQRLAVHRLPGGARVIDAMGRDDGELQWEGVFAGADAAIRARALDLMRADGGVWPLSWDAFCYTVVVSAFEAKYERENWIPYRLACTVIADEAAVLATAVLSLAQSVLADLASVTALGVADASGALVGINAPGATATGTSASAVAQDALAGLANSLNADLAKSDTALDAAGDFAGASAAAGQAARVAASRGFALRAQANFFQLGS